MTRSIQKQSVDFLSLSQNSKKKKYIKADVPIKNAIITHHKTQRRTDMNFTAEDKELIRKCMTRVKNPKKEIKILSQLLACQPYEIENYLSGNQKQPRGKL